MFITKRDLLIENTVEKSPLAPLFQSGVKAWDKVKTELCSSSLNHLPHLEKGGQGGI